MKTGMLSRLKEMSRFPGKLLDLARPSRLAQFRQVKRFTTWLLRVLVSFLRTTAHSNIDSLEANKLDGRHKLVLRHRRSKNHAPSLRFLHITADPLSIIHQIQLREI